MAFPFESLIVYKKAMVVVGLVGEALKTRTTYPLPYRDQLKRAALSIPLNISEGYGKWSGKEQAHFYRTARGSAYECVPILQLMLQDRSIDPALYRKIYGALEEVCRILTVLIRSSEAIQR